MEGRYKLPLTILSLGLSWGFFKAENHSVQNIILWDESSYCNEAVMLAGKLQSGERVDRPLEAFCVMLSCHL